MMNQMINQLMNTLDTERSIQSMELPHEPDLRKIHEVELPQETPLYRVGDITRLAQRTLRPDVPWIYFTASPVNHIYKIDNKRFGSDVYEEFKTNSVSYSTGNLRMIDTRGAFCDFDGKATGDQRYKYQEYLEHVINKSNVDGVIRYNTSPFIPMTHYLPVSGDIYGVEVLVNQQGLIKLDEIHEYSGSRHQTRYFLNRSPLA